MNALENSMDAFRRALQVPADVIELDLRMTGDGALYVIHDRRTGRTAARDLDIEHASASEASALKLRNGEPVPRIQDVLDLVRDRAAVNIEIKSSGAGSVLAGYLRSVQPLPRIIISSFLEEEVTAVRAVLPELDCAVIYDTFTSRHIKAYRSRGYGLISLRKNAVTEALVNACHARGLRIFVWTVDDEDEMKRCITWKIDGIYTNRPSLLKALIGQQHPAGS